MTPERTLRKAVEAAITALSAYVEPGKRDGESRINQLLRELDNDQVAAAIEKTHREECDGDEQTGRR